MAVSASLRLSVPSSVAQVCCALRANPKLRLRLSTPYGSKKIWSAETESPLFSSAERALGFNDANLNGFVSLSFLVDPPAGRLRRALTISLGVTRGPQRRRVNTTTTRGHPVTGSPGQTTGSKAPGPPSSLRYAVTRGTGPRYWARAELPRKWDDCLRIYHKRDMISTS